MDLNLYIGSSCYKEPEWTRQNMPEYNVPGPFEGFKGRRWSDGWKIRTLCSVCGRRVLNGTSLCGKHFKHFKKPKIKIERKKMHKKKSKDDLQISVLN